MGSSKSKATTSKSKETTAKSKETTAKSKETTTKSKETTTKSKETTTKSKTKTTKPKDDAVIAIASSTSENSPKLWSDEELLCQLRNIDSKTSANIIKMFDEGNTIPFMCRYRREMIDHMDADE